MPALTAGFLTNQGCYEGEWSIACPSCGLDYSHIRRVYTRMGGDEGEVYQGTEVGDTTGARRSALVIEFDGECEHAWELVIQQHKGINLVEVQTIAPVVRADD